MMNRILLAVLFLSLSLSVPAQSVLQDDLALKYLAQTPVSPIPHPPLLIFLHGYGSDEKDLFSLKESIPPRFLIVSARAPYTLQEGAYQWYDFNAGDHGQRQLEESGSTVIKFIDQLVTKYHADAREVYLVGFSQGAIMCYEVGLSHPQLVKGIAVLSGRIPPGMAETLAPPEKLKTLRVFISHGTADPRIKFSDGEDAVSFLRQHGINPQFHSYPGMGHTISKDVLSDLLMWLQ